MKITATAYADQNGKIIPKEQYYAELGKAQNGSSYNQNDKSGTSNVGAQVEMEQQLTKPKQNLQQFYSSEAAASLDATASVSKLFNDSNDFKANISNNGSIEVRKTEKGLALYVDGEKQTNLSPELKNVVRSAAGLVDGGLKNGDQITISAANATGRVNVSYNDQQIHGKDMDANQVNIVRNTVSTVQEAKSTDGARLLEGTKLGSVTMKEPTSTVAYKDGATYINGQRYYSSSKDPNVITPKDFAYSEQQNAASEVTKIAKQTGAKNVIATTHGIDTQNATTSYTVDGKSYAPTQNAQLQPTQGTSTDNKGALKINMEDGKFKTFSYNGKTRDTKLNDCGIKAGGVTQTMEIGGQKFQIHNNGKGPVVFTENGEIPVEIYDEKGNKIQNYNTFKSSEIPKNEWPEGKENHGAYGQSASANNNPGTTKDILTYQDRNQFKYDETNRIATLLDENGNPKTLDVQVYKNNEGRIEKVVFDGIEYKYDEKNGYVMLDNGNSIPMAYLGKGMKLSIDYTDHGYGTDYTPVLSVMSDRNSLSGSGRSYGINSHVTIMNSDGTVLNEFNQDAKPFGYESRGEYFASRGLVETGWVGPGMTRNIPVSNMNYQVESLAPTLKNVEMATDASLSRDLAQIGASSSYPKSYSNVLIDNNGNNN